MRESHTEPNLAQRRPPYVWSPPPPRGPVPWPAPWPSTWRAPPRSHARRRRWLRPPPPLSPPRPPPSPVSPPVRAASASALCEQETRAVSTRARTLAGRVQAGGGTLFHRSRRAEHLRIREPSGRSRPLCTVRRAPANSKPAQQVRQNAARKRTTARHRAVSAAAGWFCAAHPL